MGLALVLGKSWMGRVGRIVRDLGFFRQVNVDLKEMKHGEKREALQAFIVMGWQEP